MLLQEDDTEMANEVLKDTEKIEKSIDRIEIETQLDKNLIKSLLIEGKSVREVASECNCAETTVRNVAKKEDIKIKGNIKKTPELLDKIRKLVEEGKTNKEIAELLGSNPTTIRNYIVNDLHLEYNSKRTKTLTKKNIILTQEQEEVLYGSLLGDMSLDVNWKNARFIITQGGEQEAYFDHKCKIFEGLLGKPLKKDRYDKRTDKWYHKYTVKSLTNPLYTKMKEELYPNGVKTVTQNWLDKITPRGLAFWYMDDGSNNGILATNCFSDNECKLIQNWFKIKWNIETTIEHQKNKDGILQPVIYFPKQSKYKLYVLIKDFIIPEMEYKFKNWNP